MPAVTRHLKVTRFYLFALFGLVEVWLSQVPTVNGTNGGEAAVTGRPICHECLKQQKTNAKLQRLLVIKEKVLNRTRGNVKPSEPEFLAMIAERPDNMSKGNMEFRMRKKALDHKNITSAELKIFVKFKRKRKRRKGKKRRRRKRRIILRLSEKSGKNLTEIARLKVVVRKRGWQKLNLPLYLVKNLKKAPEKPLRLYISCEKCNKKTKIVLPSLKKVRQLKHMSKKRVPYIILHTQQHRARIKRQAPPSVRCTEHGARKCCIRRSFITFEEMGIGFIVDPLGYTDAECIGTCSSLRKRNSAFELDNDTISGCSPVSYADLNLTYLNQNADIEYATISKAVLTECGCR